MFYFSHDGRPPSLTAVQTIVSMSSWTMHHNEDLFPNSETFDPTRWIDPVNAKSLDKYLFSFGKGSRQCVGMPYVHPLFLLLQ